MSPFMQYGTLPGAYPVSTETNEHMIEVTFTKHHPGKADAEEALLTFWIYLSNSGSEDD